MFQILGLEDAVTERLNINDFEKQIEDIVARYYPDMTELGYQVLLMSKALPRYPDHE